MNVHYEFGKHHIKTENQLDIFQQIVVNQKK